ncbi:MAG: cytidylate kinase-like family protein [Gemmatimonadales bacterium]|nr:cytidylate kinase-like family protein [Gemmatimonadales bacterium]
MSLLITDKLIQRQINHWNRLRNFLKDEPHPEPALKQGPVITVSRLVGSGGRTLAENLASRLDLELQDQSLMEKIAEDKNLEQSLLAQLDESGINQADLWVRGVLNQRIFMRDQFHGALVQTVSRLAARGNVVFLGRGANLILAENATLRVRVIASRQTRLDRIRLRLEISRAEARAILVEIERRREEFIRKIFKEDPGRPENFDLTINTDRLEPETAVEMVIMALLDRQTSTPESMKKQSAEE